MGGVFAVYPDAREGAFKAIGVCQADVGSVLDHLVEVLGP